MMISDYIQRLISTLDRHEILNATLKLFIIIDIIGCIPFILKTKEASGKVAAGKTTLTVAAIGFGFLFFGQRLLEICELELPPFRAAGGLILFILGVELLFDIEISKVTLKKDVPSYITPLGFPVIGGTGMMTMLILLQENHMMSNIIIAFLLNLVVIYLVIRFLDWIEHLLSPLLLILMAKIMGLMLIATGIQLFKALF